jgi:transcriptional regulator NrdR family protein
MSACPVCGTWRSRVTETRSLSNGWHLRTRYCMKNANHKWKTYEIPEELIEMPPNVRQLNDTEDPIK